MASAIDKKNYVTTDACQDTVRLGTTAGLTEVDIRTEQHVVRHMQDKC